MTDDELIDRVRAGFYGADIALAARIHDLIAERDEARAKREWTRASWLHEMEQRTKAEAEVARLRGLLQEARGYIDRKIERADFERLNVHPNDRALLARIDADLATEDRT